MSAFQVSSKHVSAIVTAGVAAGLVSDIKAAGKLLTAANHASIAARYRDAGKAPRFSFVAAPVRSAVEIAKLCNCYDYQAMEVENYDATPAAKLVAAIRASVLAFGVESRKLAGYDAAAWEI